MNHVVRQPYWIENTGFFVEGDNLKNQLSFNQAIWLSIFIKQYNLFQSKYDKCDLNLGYWPRT